MTHIIEKYLKDIGITINGSNAWDIQVHNNHFLDRILHEQSLGGGESYMEGWWDCEKLDELFFRLMRSQLQNKLYSKYNMALIKLKNTLFNQQTPSKSREVSAHYTLGNPLFEKMLGKSMAYTCGYWNNAASLDEAQFAKYDLVCKKLDLQPGETVLELGCGWGGLAKRMAEKYGCHVVAFDISSEPANYAKQLCKDLPVNIYQCDYRDTQIYNSKNIKFDKLVSVGVLEHVGNKNYKTFLNIARSFIKPEGIFLLHSIGANERKNYCDPWINQYIFANGVLPSIEQLGNVFENTFVVEDLHNLSVNYDKTLLAWHHNFNQHWTELVSNNKHYTESFRRMMNYYLLSCAGSFRARAMQLWQFVLTPEGKLHGCPSARTQ